MLGALKQAGETAIGYYDAPSARLKSDRTIVTEADHAIEAIFEELWDHPESGSYLIGEETIHRKDEAYVSNAFSRTAWVVDPIDGTAPYAHHIPTWGISIARMVRGTITDGAIYLPVTDEVFITRGAEILYGSIAGQTPLSVVRSGPEPSGMVALTQAVAKQGSFIAENPVQALVCAVLPLAYLLMGRFLGYTGTLKLWDIAGAVAMLTRAEFCCVLMNGTTVGTEVSSEVYHLDKDSPKRWFLKDRLFCGPSREVVDYLLSATTIPG